MPSNSFPQTDKEERELLLQLASPPSLSSTLSSSSSILSSTSTSTVKEPHDALFRAFNIPIIYKNVFDSVEPADQAALALTCRRLQKSLAGVADVRTLRKRLSRPDFLNVLWAIAYDLPDHYVCEQCMYLHRDARRKQKKTEKSTTGHAADAAVVQKASDDFMVGKYALGPLPELEPPCRNSTSIRASSPSSTPAYDASMSTCTFTGRLSSIRRTPLAGLTHRDVQLLLKRVRMLQETREDGDCRKTALFAAKDIDQNATKESPSRSAPRSPASVPAQDPASRWQSWRSKLRNCNRLPWITGRTQRNQFEDETHKNTHTRVDMNKSVRLALRPFLAQRLRPVPGTMYNGVPTLKYKFVPRVVLCQNGHGRAHFLLQTVVHAPMNVYLWFLPFSICPHQILCNDTCPVWMQAKRAVSSALIVDYRNHGTKAFWSPHIGISPTQEGVQSVRPPFRLDTAVTCVMHDRRLTNECRSDSIQHMRCQKNAFKEYNERLSSFVKDDIASARACAMARAQIEGRTVSSSCDRCPTDFVVQGANDPVGRTSKDEVVITVWQDFGPEAPMTDELWQSHIPGLFLQAGFENAQAPFTEPNTWQSGPTVSHSPGSVRTLFETGEPAYEF